MMSLSCTQLCMALKKSPRFEALSTLGHSPSSREYTWPNIEPPRRFFSAPRSINQSLESTLASICGVRVLRTSITGAKAEIIKLVGAVTALSWVSPWASVSVHAVRIDIESLPTGTVISSSGHISMPTASTAR